uniref:Sec1 family domain containing 2 n=1 Tax=Hucho hucho TaxID=62062 RepID=A0A4W5PSN0_9TELE
MSLCVLCGLQALGDSDFAGVLRQLLSLMKPRAAKGEEGSSSVYSLGSRSGEEECGPDELLVLLVYLYSLVGEAQTADDEEEEEKVERELIGALTLVITRETELSPLLQKLTGCGSIEELTMERAHTAVEGVFDTLRELSHARDHLKQLKSVYTASDGVHQAMYRPFLRQVLEEIFHPDRPESPDIEHMSGSLTDMLKTGFSMFMKVSRPHPSDHALLFLFLVGGVTPSELRLIREVVSAHKPGTQVLVLSTRLLRPTDVPELLFTTQRLVPDIGV